MLLDVQPYPALNPPTSIFCKAKTVVSETDHLHFNRHALSNSQILIVDNHIDTCDLFALVLEEAGANVVVATSCETALVQIQKNPPDILVSEIGLPGENGLTLIRKTRELVAEMGQTLLALAVTNYVEREDQSEIASAGFHRYLSKPVDIFEFLDVVTELFEQKQNS